MKITIERASLLRVLSHVQSIAERRNTIPILANVLLVANGDTLKVSATDLDIQTIETVSAVVETPGRTTVTAHLLYDIVRKLPDASQISLSITNGRMLLTAGRARFTLPVIEADQFPQIVTGELPTSFKIPAEDFAHILSRSRFAMSTEETRYYLNGIFLHLTTGSLGQAQLRAVATDGHRLAVNSIDCPAGLTGMPDVIVPRKCVGEIAKIIDDIEGDIIISMSSQKIKFEMGSLVYVSKLVDGTFPDYTRVIPTSNSKVMRISASEFATSIDRVSAIASEKTRAVKLTVATDSVTISVKSPETGSASEQMPADYTSDSLEVGFNARYLIDVLAQHRNDDVEIIMQDAASPTIVRKIGDAESLTVIMPLRI